MLQVAFQHASTCAGGPCRNGEESTDSWEFPIIADGIDRGVRSHVSSSAGDSAILAEATEFTVLQRLFRAALRGQLGPKFERAGLVGLMRDAAVAEPIRYLPTPQWSRARESAARVASELGNLSEAEIAAVFRTKAEAEASRAYLAALLAPRSGAQFAGEAMCR
jgi:hypothetical protein